MFDPQRTRYSNRKYYTRKGQVIQAKRIDAPLGIESRLVPMYKNYLLKNHLISSGDLPPAPPPVIKKIYFPFDQSTTEFVDLAVTIAPTTVTNSMGIAIGTDPDDNGLWIVYLFLVYNSGSFTIPTGFSYKSWSYSRQAIDTDFVLLNEDDLLVFSFPLQVPTPSVSQSVTIALDNKINKNIVTFE